MPSFRHFVGVGVDEAMFGLLKTVIRMTHVLALHATDLDVNILSRTSRS